MANNSILTQAKQHFLEKVAGSTNEIEVPEWNATLYIHPVTLRTMDKMSKILKDEDYLKAMVYLIIERSRDENGAPVFTDDDYNVFMNELDPDVIIRVGEQIAADISESKDDAAKN